MKVLLIECGVAQTRGALLVADQPMAFFFAPARGDEAKPRKAISGDVKMGRVRRVVPAIGGAFVDIGDEEDALLSFSETSPKPNEGAAIAVRVRRPAIGTKGAVVTMDWRKSLSARDIQEIEGNISGAKPGDCLSAAVDASVEIARQAKGAAIKINDATAAAALKQALPTAQVEIEQDLFDHYDGDAALEEALEHVVSLPGDGRLIFDQTEGPCVIDVDAGALAGTASQSVNDKTNSLAASRLYGELSRRAIGGRIIVDFLPPSSGASSKALLQMLREQVAKPLGGRAGNLSKDGLFDMTLPKTSASLLERATRPAGSQWPVSGRQFSLDWIAKEAIRRLEQALSKASSARPKLVVSSDLSDYLNQRPEWTDRLAEKYTRRFSIDIDQQKSANTYDLAE